MLFFHANQYMEVNVRFLGLLLLALAFTSHAEVTDWIPFELDSGHVRITVEVDGIEGNAIIDSGSQLNVINKKFIEKHDLGYEISTFTGVSGVHHKSRQPIYESVPTQLFGSEMELNLVGADFGHSGNALIIGAPFLRNFIVQFDYPNGRLRLATRDALNLDEVANLPMRAQKGSGRPLVRVTLNDEKDIWMILDTGNSGGIYMKRGIAARRGWLDEFALGKTMSRGVNGIAYTDTFTLPSVIFGPFKVKNVDVAVPVAGEEADFGERYKIQHSRIRGVKVEGLAGYGVFKHFVVTLDYQSGKGHAELP
ncbi:aspartyl protease family protein [Idiomarina abyssalis]|uniref:aspartyl protease family protein n=1 Tax=Idiomarina abyssalis TaxID=86102 RepID=UPI003A94A570